MKTFVFSLFATLSLCFTQTARADLILNIDTTTQEFFFTGDFFGEAGGNLVQWALGTGGVVDSFDISTGLDISGNSFNGAPTLAVGDTRIEISVPVTSGGLFTMDGNGTRFSYSSLDPTRLAFFEGLDGSILPVTSGEAPDISVVASPSATPTAIPEPSPLLLLSFMTLAGTVILRWRRPASAISP